MPVAPKERGPLIFWERKADKIKFTSANDMYIGPPSLNLTPLRMWN